MENVLAFSKEHVLTFDKQHVQTELMVRVDEQADWLCKWTELRRHVLRTHLLFCTPDLCFVSDTNTRIMVLADWRYTLCEGH